MNIILPKDYHGNVIQALTLDAPVLAAIGGTAQRVALPADTELVRIAAPVNCFIKFGDVTVEAAQTDPLMLTGVEIFRVPPDVTHISTIQSGAVTGNLSVTKMV